MLVRIETDCNYAGCNTIHYVEVEEGADLDDLVQDFIDSDICPTGFYEICDEEECERVEEEGYDIE